MYNVFMQQCVAIIGPKNVPLYLHTSDRVSSSATKWHFLAHSALDMVEECGMCLKKIKI